MVNPTRSALRFFEMSGRDPEMAKRDPNQQDSMSMTLSTLRLPESMAKKLGAIARADGLPVSEVLGRGMEEHIMAPLSHEGVQRAPAEGAGGRSHALKDLGIEG